MGSDDDDDRAEVAERREGEAAVMADERWGEWKMEAADELLGSKPGKDRDGNGDCCCCWSCVEWCCDWALSEGGEWR